LHTKQRFLKYRFEIDCNYLYISILTINIDDVNDAKSGLTSILFNTLIINKLTLKKYVLVNPVNPGGKGGSRGRKEEVGSR
jgi:hypothetical protein